MDPIENHPIYTRDNNVTNSSTGGSIPIETSNLLYQATFLTYSGQTLQATTLVTTIEGTGTFQDGITSSDILSLPSFVNICQLAETEMVM